MRRLLSILQLFFLVQKCCGCLLALSTMFVVPNYSKLSISPIRSRRVSLSARKVTKSSKKKNKQTIEISARRDSRKKKRKKRKNLKKSTVIDEEQEEAETEVLSPSLMFQKIKNEMNQAANRKAGNQKLSNSKNEKSIIKNEKVEDSLSSSKEFEEELESRFTSWEQFLGQSVEDEAVISAEKDCREEKSSDTGLPTMNDLFPATKAGIESKNKPPNTSKSINSTVPSSGGIQGVVPVSELFYSSRKSMSSSKNAIMENSLSSNENTNVKNGESQMLRNVPAKIKRDRKSKLVRKGLYTSVAGITIRSDPPQRSVELLYDRNHTDWASVITLNCHHFGPLLWKPNKLTRRERELYCEYFVNTTMKWNICPKYLEKIVQAEFPMSKTNYVGSSGQTQAKNNNEEKSSIENQQYVSFESQHHSKKIITQERNHFPDFSNEKDSPWKGTIGSRLLDAVVERSKKQQPRVIAIGDVHGCIEELQALLRKCKYQPGDLVVFLGDLVCKGPDSVAVVKLAREIGALGVRGNHDFEVIRWAQGIRMGAGPPNSHSEKYVIAKSLSPEDVSWLCSLPWYMSSRELSSLFVHAGFVAGIRLAKQNPRMMMNMRSILPDGTVTSKGFSNFPWSRLWDGPQTVLFGHDADRGLQQNDHAIGLDTGCVYGGRLTACILPEKRIVSVGAKMKYRSKSRKR